jgi:glycosyltransferase involved in cell wall biosynthesis
MKSQKKKDKKVVFIPQGHKINREWAESLNAKFIKTYASGEGGNNPLWKRMMRAFFTCFAYFKIPKDTDAIFVEEGLGILPAYLFLKLRKNKKGVVLLSGPLPYYLNDPSSGIFYKFRKSIWKVINRFEGVIVKSPITYDLINVPDENKKIVYSYVDNEKLFKIKSHKNNLISLGKIAEIKGINKMLNVFKEVRKEFPKTKYYVLGKGELPEKPKGLEKVGYTKEIEKYFEKSSIMLHLSRADAFPLAVLEAMAAGVVPIVSDKVGTKDIIKKIDSSLIVDVEDEKQAEEKIKELLRNKRKLNRLSKRCREEASKLTKEKQIKKFQKAFWGFVE